MSPERLSPLDASFLAVESPAAHMHVGWAAVFAPPRDGSPRPDFREIRDHIAFRLDRAPRYRQRLELVPLGVSAPEWVDDPEFDLGNHVRHAATGDLDALIDEVMSHPLPRDRPLWEFWIADELPDGRIALVGKAHHCMVDGLGAVQLGSLLLDLEPQREPTPRQLRLTPPDAPRREAVDVLVEGVLQRVEEQSRAALASLRALADPMRTVESAGRFARTLAGAALPPAPDSPLNGRSSPRRHLARVTRPLDDLRAVRARFGTTVNDVLLAATTGALRSFLAERGSAPAALKAMVPVSVRADGDELGNRISFLFVRLPCAEPDPLVRLMQVHRDTATAKRSGQPSDASAVVQSLGYAPRTVQRLASQLMSSRRMFNLVVSNVPGPRPPVFLRGCRLEAAWPVVPLAEGHALSVGMTTVGETACFGLYADQVALPDADRLGEHLDGALDELLNTL